jgi:hypothetical protein
MTAKVIQGSFLGGQPKWSSSIQGKILLSSIQAKRAAGPPAPAFAGGSPNRPAFSAHAPGPPAPAFADRMGALQRHGGSDVFAVEAGPLGLA